MIVRTRIHLFFVLFFFVMYPRFLVSHAIEQAIVVVPVVDLYGTRHASLFPYDAKPASHCSRLMQLVFNEVVDIIKEEHNEVLVALPHFFHCTTQHPQHSNNRYWLQKKYIRKMSEIPHNMKTVIPPMPHITNTTSAPSNAFVILKKPWTHTKTGVSFSAGTRFVATKTTRAYATVHWYNAEKDALEKARIPAAYVVAIPAHATHATRQKAYVELVHAWAHPEQGVIPYVFGGCSYTKNLTTYNPHITTIDNNCHISKVEDHNTTTPILSGFDCAGLIARAAQACGIPYFLKNSSMVATCLQPLTSHTQITAGDIIWIPGHVMIVGNLKKNTILEARSFYHGYGKVHEIPLSQEFKNITSFYDLMTALQKKIPLERLNAEGDVVQTVREGKILAMASAWDVPIIK